MKTLKEKIVEILEPTTLNDWENMASNEELERIADRILALISQDREELAGKIEKMKRSDGSAQGDMIWRDYDQPLDQVLSLLKNQK